MGTLDDCVGMSGLDPAQTSGILMHEHVPEIAATALASYLVHRAGGIKRIRKMLIEDVHVALHADEVAGIAELLSSPRHFLDQGQWLDKAF